MFGIRWRRFERFISEHVIITNGLLAVPRHFRIVGGVYQV